MLTRPEKEAVITLVIVVSALCLFWIILTICALDLGITAYSEDVSDGTRVSFEGIIENQKITATGGHLLLTVSGVTVFVQNGGSELRYLPGDRIKVLGTAATYGGKREITVDRITDITILT